MRIIRLSAMIFVIGLFLTACGSNQQQTETKGELGGEYWAKDNLDLQRVGDLLERSDSPQEFEAYLNEDDGINNLDLNGDGYVDYISVDEFEDRGDSERGLSLYCRFGPNVIQEIATIVFYRDGLNYPGARALVTGDENIYGDNYYYETNWADRTVELISFLFSRRDEFYHSPYYYDNYPPDYAVYEVVETPVYRARVERIDPQPVFVYTRAPEVVSKVKIKSPHRGKQMDKIYARLAKPTRQQIEFIRNNPRPQQARRADSEVRSEDRRGDKPGRPDVAPGADPRPREVRQVEPERGGPPRAFRTERPNVETPRPARLERPRVNVPRPARVEKPKAEGPRPARFEQRRMNSPKRARIEQPRMNPSRPARVEQPRMNSPRPARVDLPRMSSPSPAKAGSDGARGGGRGKKP